MNKVIEIILPFMFFIVYSSSLSFSQEDKKDNYFKYNGVPFEISSEIDEYKVSGIWFPFEYINGSASLRGPAIFHLENVKSGSLSIFTSNSIALLNNQYWQKNKIMVH